MEPSPLPSISSHSTTSPLLQMVKTWVANDQEIRLLQKQQAVKRNENKLITTQLVEVMKQNEIDCFDIKNGIIVYRKRNIKKPISKTELLRLLTTYFQGDDNKANDVNQYILENREVVVKETIQMMNVKET